MTYRKAWLLILGAGITGTLLVATSVVLGFVSSHRQTVRVLYVLVGVCAAIALGYAFVKLWRVRPSTRSG